MIVKSALEYAEKHVFFKKKSVISGPFVADRYPFIIEPLQSLDNIRIRTTTVYGPAQSFKTVFLNIATAYRLAVLQETVYMIAQSDPDAREFAQVKMWPFLEQMPHLMETIRRKNIELGQWANHEVIVSGCGLNAQQSKSARFIHTDESHLFLSGTLAALKDRAGQAWNQHQLNATTAADDGTEVDSLWHDASQKEWNLRCIHCNGLFEPLWIEQSTVKYNGHKCIIWEDSQSETATLDSIRFACPHCDKEIIPSPRNRVLMDEGSKYISQNPAADASKESFRWNAFACRAKPLRELLSIYLTAMKAAALGDYKPFENFQKKQAVATWRGEIPDMGVSTIGRDHSLSEIEVVEEDLVTGSFDVQSEGGFHIWALADVWHPSGDSKRLAYEKLASFDDLRAFQLRNGIKDFDSKKHRHPFFCGDHGHLESDVFAACARYRWLALKSGDELGFTHIEKRKGGDLHIEKPWSVVRNGNPLLGKKHQGEAKLCFTRLWSKPRMYPITHALINGETPRRYSIATDINPIFIDQLHSYRPITITDKKTGASTKTIWKKTKKDDHAFICATQSLMLAMMHGVYSVPNIT